jgi:Na+-translocating ferredoxin:NAD+ oxidoreductase RnfC subunit
MTGEAKDRLNQWASSCCECNVCTLFACPEKLDPKNICVDTKLKLREEQKGFSREEAEEVFRDVHPVREGREIPITSLYQRLGIKIYDRKAEFKNIDENIPEVLIPVKYNFGKAANPVVKIGSKVSEGEMIASTDENDTGVPVHSSIDGIVKEISEKGILISNNF